MIAAHAAVGFSELFVSFSAIQVLLKFVELVLQAAHIMLSKTIVIHPKLIFLNLDPVKVTAHLRKFVAVDYASVVVPVELLLQFIFLLVNLSSDRLPVVVVKTGLCRQSADENGSECEG